MIVTQERVDIDEILFEKYRSQLEKNDGFAQSEDALVSQAKTALASGPVCKIVIPSNKDISYAFLPHLVRENCSMTTKNFMFRVRDVMVILYNLVILRGSARN